MIPARASRALGFAALAAGALLAASAFDLETPVAVDVFPGKITWSVAGATLSAGIDIAGVTAFTIATHDGLFPTGARSLVSRTGDGRVTEWPIARRFSHPPGGPDPVGDWWVDAAIPETEVFAAEANLGSDFTIEGSFAGRYHQHATIHLRGSPGIRCSFRRGLLNNDLHILDDDGNVLASGSIDPRPCDRLGAIAATLLRAIGGGSLLIALWLGCSWRARPSVPVAEQYAPGSFIVATIVLSAAGAAALSGWTSTNVFEGLPHQPDEVVYRLQSEWILSGRLAGEKPLCPDHFEIPFTYFRGDLWVGHYPPAWPLILAPGVALKIAWLVPAALRFAFVLLIGLLGWRLAGRWAGAGAALLASTSPLATLLFASTMPHAGSATLLLAGLFLCLPRQREGTSIRWVVAGAAFATSFAIRPLTTVAYAIPLGLFLLHEATVGRRRARELIYGLAGGLAAVGPALAANAFLTGSPWHFPYSLADRPMVSPDHLMFGIRNVDAILASLVPMLHGWGWPWLPDLALLTLPLAFVAVPFLSGSATREEKLLLALATSVVMVNIVAQASGLHGFGPRYAFAACAPLWILTASGVTRLARLEHRRLPAAVLALLILIVSAAVSAPSRLELYHGYNDVDHALSTAAGGLPPCSIVLLPERDWRGWAHATPWLDPSDDDMPLFAIDLGDNVELTWCFPDRRHFRWSEGRMEPTNHETPIP